MKSKHINRSLLSMSILWAMQSALAQQQTIYSTPFANVPLHLDSKSVTTSTQSGAVKPNVMFFVDDSGSMGWGVDASRGEDNIAFGKTFSSCPAGSITKATSQKNNIHNICFNLIASHEPAVGSAYKFKFMENENTGINSYLSTEGKYGFYLDTRNNPNLHFDNQRLWVWLTRNDYNNNPGNKIKWVDRTKIAPETTYEANTQYYNPYYGEMMGYYMFRDTRKRVTASELDKIKIDKNDPKVFAFYCKNENDCYKIMTGETARQYWRTYSQEDVSRTRILIVMNALHQLLNENKDLAHWNIHSLHGTINRHKAGTNGEYKKGRRENFLNHNYMDADKIREFINALTPYGATPTTKRYVDVVRNMIDPKHTTLRCQKNFIIVLSDGDSNGYKRDAKLGFPYRVKEIDFTDAEKALYVSSFKNKYEGLGRLKPEPDITKTAAGALYNDDSGEMGNGLSAFSQALYKADLFTNENRSTKDKDGKSWDEPDFPQQNIETFTIGFGSSITPNGKAYLQNAATGGECKGNELQGEAKKGKCYFSAESASELADVLAKIIDNVKTDSAFVPGQDQTFSVATPSATGASSTESAALLTLDPTTWTSTLKFAAFGDDHKPKRDADGKIVLVGAGYQPPLGRSIIINHNNRPMFLTKNADGAVLQQLAAIFGMEVSEYRRGLFPWLMRDTTDSDADINQDVQSIPNRVVEQYRVRSEDPMDEKRQMADVIGSPTIAIGRDGNQRQKYIMTAANDGMVYIFKSEENNDAFKTQPYNLALNYFPVDMQRQSADLSLTTGKAVAAVANENYGKTLETPHIYLNNGGISWIKTPGTGGLPQQYSAFGNMGQGGRGTYALNIAGRDRTQDVPTGLDAQHSDYLNSIPLWETEKGTTNSLGYTISTPYIGQVATEVENNQPKLTSGVRLYAFVANGYSTGIDSIPYDSTPTLYVYDAFGQEFGTETTKNNKGNIKIQGQLGKQVAKLSVPGNQKGALSTPTLLDSNLDGVIDFAFAGDQFGNLWRFDLRGNPNEWGANRVTQLYQGKANAVQPITAAPTLFKLEEENKFIVIFGTGSDIFEKDQRDTNQQMVMGIYHDIENPGSALDSSSRDIVDQVMTEVDGESEDGRTGVKVRELTENEMADGKRAWRIMLKPGAGERKQQTGDGEVVSFEGSEKVTTQPQLLLGTLYLSTRIYKFEQVNKSKKGAAAGAETCNKDESSSTISTQGDSWLMTLDAKNGSSPRKRDGYSYIEGYSKKEDGGSASGTGGDEGDRAIGGIQLGYLSSAVSVFNRSGLSQDVLQTDAHGNVSSGEIPKLEEAKAILGDLKRTCLDASANYEAMVSVADSTGKDTIRNFNLEGNRCPTGEAFIRVNWREIPL